MSEALRGSRLGATSYENDTHVVPAERIVVAYDCPRGHVTTVPFSTEAEEIPVLWECRCGAEALQRSASRPDDKPTRHVRTHWDMLLERRTIADLEVLLDERLELLHGDAPAKRTRKSA